MAIESAVGSASATGAATGVGASTAAAAGAASASGAASGVGSGVYPAAGTAAGTGAASAFELSPWATLTQDATFLTRVAADLARPALFGYLAWPTGDVRAHSHTGSVTALGETWAGVGDFAKVEFSDATMNGSAMEATLGLRGMVPAAAQPSTEESAIGVVGECYLGLFDENWENPALDRMFYGYVAETARVSVQPRPDGYVVDLSVRLDDRSNPRRAVRTYHAVGEGVAGDTSRQLMVSTVGKDLVWPES